MTKTKAAQPTTEGKDLKSTPRGIACDMDVDVGYSIDQCRTLAEILSEEIAKLYEDESTTGQHTDRLYALANSIVTVAEKAHEVLDGYTDQLMQCAGC